MNLTKKSPGDALLLAGNAIPQPTVKDTKGSIGGDLGYFDRGLGSGESFESETKLLLNSNLHHPKLQALSAELMRPPLMLGSKAGTNDQPPLAVVVGMGLVEEARKRWRGRKERYLHWDRIKIDGRETVMQRANTSTAAPSAPSPALSDGSGPKKTRSLGRVVAPRHTDGTHHV